MIVSSSIFLDSAPLLLSMNVVPLRYADRPNGPKYRRAFLASVVARSISGLWSVSHERVQILTQLSKHTTI